ncbi:DUF6006 family protein [Atlanticothrix silvestris]|nr:DUF6006 family protein [Atlanticothrix silvestris]
MRYNSNTKIADGWTTWRGNRHPLNTSRLSIFNSDRVLGKG